MFLKVMQTLRQFLIEIKLSVSLNLKLYKSENQENMVLFLESTILFKQIMPRRTKTN